MEEEDKESNMSSVGSVENMLVCFDTKLKEMEETLDLVMSDLSESSVGSGSQQADDMSVKSKQAQIMFKDYLYTEYSTLLHENDCLQRQIQNSKIEINNLKAEKECAFSAIEHLQQEMFRSDINRTQRILISRKSKENSMQKDALIKELQSSANASEQKIEDLKLSLAKSMQALEESESQRKIAEVSLKAVESDNISASFLIEELCCSLESVVEKLTKKPPSQGSKAGPDVHPIDLNLPAIIFEKKDDSLANKIDYANALVSHIMDESDNSIEKLKQESNLQRKETLMQIEVLETIQASTSHKVEILTHEKEIADKTIFKLHTQVQKASEEKRAMEEIIENLKKQAVDTVESTSHKVEILTHEKEMADKTIFKLHTQVKKANEEKREMEKIVENLRKQAVDASEKVKLMHSTKQDDLNSVSSTMAEEREPIPDESERFVAKDETHNDQLLDVDINSVQEGSQEITLNGPTPKQRNSTRFEFKADDLESNESFSSSEDLSEKYDDDHFDQIQHLNPIEEEDEAPGYSEDSFDEYETKEQQYKYRREPGSSGNVIPKKIFTTSRDTTSNDMESIVSLETTNNDMESIVTLETLETLETKATDRMDEMDETVETERTRGTEGSRIANEVGKRKNLIIRKKKKKDKNPSKSLKSKQPKKNVFKCLVRSAIFR